MSNYTPAVASLLALPGSERRDALEALVVAELRASLLMAETEELPLDAGFFGDLGFTSLRLTEVKRRLEDVLGCEISTNALFNEPTTRHLIAYLAERLLPSVERAPVSPAVPAGQAVDRRLAREALSDLFEV
ncbi:acyl carrier protein [Microbispora sp. NPDC049125]|uniref:acyl carrier protein n=1 Tax=Microbispora sp. NPDC049125 TaxID=3154929 RepID=UPI003464EE67